ncbi:response regulator [Candidatus Saccharibacteria bacterium]|nr:response regulator [Candidatus Saccharibacteria bacterium]MCB9834894.1 response regulator [Candidatus Nomurabacteria bacterium]
MKPQKKILLVEDDDQLSKIYQTRLKAEGFDLKVAQDGEEGLATALDFKPDLILLDIMMPKISGYDVLDILKNTPEFKSKIVIISALSQPSDIQKAKSLGADLYLVKSQVSIAEVVDSIKSLVS